MQQLLMGFRVRGKNVVLFDQVNVQLQFIQGDIILEIAIQPVRFLHQESPASAVLLAAFTLEKLHHVGKLPAPAALGRFHVGIFRQDGETLALGIFPEQLELGGDGKAFAFLFLGGNAGIDNGFFQGGNQFRIGHWRLLYERAE
ncbi:MAG TPA: hypothetical protein VJ385_08065 [Fibrobacteria bacterium]|nr:hypothetical protein [Fibrobacteria bacterium]